MYGLYNVKWLVDNIINFLAKGDQWLMRKKTIKHNNIIKKILYALKKFGIGIKPFLCILSC